MKLDLNAILTILIFTNYNVLENRDVMITILRDKIVINVVLIIVYKLYVKTIYLVMNLITKLYNKNK